MIEERAIVERTGEGVAWVRTGRKSACSGCSLNKGCGVSVLERMLGERSTTLRVVDPVSVRRGDEVVIGIDEQALVRGSLAVYIVPLVAMILSAVAGSTLLAPGLGLPAEGSSIVAGLLGLAGGLLWLSRFSRRIGRDARYRPIILRKVQQAPTAGRYIPVVRI
ncbi:MAG TPA: Fis family transcriptional regulator [Gammaproteobacteria bacterium]|nr:Fis family transcriptional regulator [Gammaproteobacteria bacterium]